MVEHRSPSQGQSGARPELSSQLFSGGHRRRCLDDAQSVQPVRGYPLGRWRVVVSGRSEPIFTRLPGAGSDRLRGHGPDTLESGASRETAGTLLDTAARGGEKRIDEWDIEFSTEAPTRGECVLAFFATRLVHRPPLFDPFATAPHIFSGMRAKS